MKFYGSQTIKQLHHRFHRKPARREKSRTDRWICLYDVLTIKNSSKNSYFITTKIFNYIESNKGDCEVYPAPFAVYLQNDNQNYFEPDISVVCDKNKLDEKGCHGAPDFYNKVASPPRKTLTQQKSSENIKKREFGNIGYVLPDEERIFVQFF